LLLVVSFFLATTFMNCGGAVVDVAGSVKEAQDLRASAEVKEAERRAHSATTEATRKQKQQTLKESAALIPELRRATFVDFDLKRRDEIADRMVELSSEGAAGKVSTELWNVGATRHLLRLGPDKAGRFFLSALMKERDWKALDSFDVNTLSVREQLRSARLFCMAGYPDVARQIYAANISQDDGLTRPNYVDALACGVAEPDLNLMRNPPNGVAQMLIARENMDLLPQAFQSISHIKKFRQSSTLFEAGAVLFAKGAIAPPEFLKTISETPYKCRPRDFFDEEMASPATLLEAATKLKEANLPTADKDQVAMVVDALHTGVLLSALSRGQDLRDQVSIKRVENQACLARAEYEFEPKAAVDRLKPLIKAAKGRDLARLHHLMALTQARLGDFESALAHAKAMKVAEGDGIYKPEASLLIMAMAHRLGRPEEVDTSKLPERDALFWTAVNGSEEERAAYRHGAQSQRWAGQPGYYLDGALAPGHEEALLEIRAPTYGAVTEMWFRAEAARWRGDLDTEKALLDRRAQLLAQFADGKNGGYHMVMYRYQ